MHIDDFLKNSFKDLKKIKKDGEFFNYFEIDEIPDARILMTSGLSQCKMNVHEKHKGEEYAELFFLLPSYWKEEDLYLKENEWVFPCLVKSKKHIEQENTWFGHGHTFSLKGLESPIFRSSKETHFIISDPIELRGILEPLKSEQKSIRFLAIIPIFKKELYFKEARGTFKLFEKFRQYRVTEKMDGYRESVIQSRLIRLFKR